MSSVKLDHYARVPRYTGEITEEELKDWHTYPPMTVWGDSLQYVCASVLSKIFPLARPSQAQVRQVYDRLVGYARTHTITNNEFVDDQRGIDLVWSKVVQEISTNRGLYKYMDDWGVNSRSFFAFLDLVPHAIALESAFGVNFDNAGHYHELAPGCISRKCAVTEPIFVDLRRRAHHSGFLARWAYDNHPDDYIITLGCGLMVELRKFKRFSLEEIQKMHIVACDEDPRVRKDLDTVFQHDFGVPFEASGIEFRQCRIEDLFKDERLHGRAAAVLLDGVASYLDEDQLFYYLSGMKNFCRPYGRMACDLQILEPSLIRCATSLLWKSDMHPELSANRAVSKMYRMAKNLDVDCQYEIDPRNPRPVGVYFYLGTNIGLDFQMPIVV